MKKILLSLPNNLLLLTQTLGATAISFVQSIGSVSIFTINSVLMIFRPPMYGKIILTRVMEIGFYSVPVVGLTALFAGMVMALQIHIGFSDLASEAIIAKILVSSLTRELSPVLAALVVSGRIASSIAAEIGSMKISNQLDAIELMGVNSIKYTVTPRIIAGIICLPLLAIVADAVGILGGYLVAIFSLGLDNNIYIEATISSLETSSVMSGVIKSAFFGFIITIIGSYMGYKAGNSAKGVGYATTSAVVVSSVLIFVTDYMLTSLLI